MLLKSGDDRAADLDALEALLRRPDLDTRQQRAINDEIWNIRQGAKAEADAAYQLDFDLRDSKHWAVIHDLRLEVDGRVAQIDHLVISRMLEVFVCESKSFTGGVRVNERGEWTRFDGRRPIGIPSPVEQNRRHIQILEQAVKLGLVELPRRIVAIKPTYKNIVLVSAEGSVTRPEADLPGLDSVVKVDQFRTHLRKRDLAYGNLLKFLDTAALASFGQQLVALHAPIRFDWAARFGVRPAPPEVRVRPPKQPWLVKYDGSCSGCGRMLLKGTPAVWRNAERRMYCVDCAASVGLYRQGV